MIKAALLIGISDYQEGLGLKRLRSPVQDAQAMQRILIDPEIGGFAEDQVTLLIDEDRLVIERAIFDLFANRGSKDLILFYFSGHGVLDEEGKFYLAVQKTEKQAERSGLVTPTAVAASYIKDQMSRSASTRQILILDCCHSGAFGDDLEAKGEVDLQAQLGGKGRAILTSSTSYEYSFEQKGSELSLYTRYLVEGIETGAADQDEDGLISADELHRYVRDRVQEAAPAMTPQFFPVREGYSIKIARARIGDPKLKYRKEVDQIVRENLLHQNSEFIDPVLDRMLLETRQLELGLTEAEGAAIEAEVLQPYQDRQEKLKRYELGLQRALARSNPLKELDQIKLQRLQQRWGLRDEDIQPIERRLGVTSGSSGSSAPPQPATVPKPAPQIVTFAVVIVDRQGNEIQRRQEQNEFRREDLGNGVTLDLVRIPAGSFEMGQTEAEKEELIRQRGKENYQKYFVDESPKHTVTIKEPFWMGKYQVTQAQWRAVADLLKADRDLNSDPSAFKGDDRPVEQVSWFEAVEFCKRLSQKSGRAYRLPSEAEWEYACRAGTTTPFHFGETITTDLANYDGNYIYRSGPKGIYRKETAPVGSFGIANAFGLYDMHGNVWEWCLDHWHESYVDKPDELKRNGHDPWLSSNDNSPRMLRGGCWVNYPEDCRSAFRSRPSPGSRYFGIGFRVVCAAAWTLS